MRVFGMFFWRKSLNCCIHSLWFIWRAVGVYSIGIGCERNYDSYTQTGITIVVVVATVAAVVLMYLYCANEIKYT